MKLKVEVRGPLNCADIDESCESTTHFKTNINIQFFSVEFYIFTRKFFQYELN